MIEIRSAEPADLATAIAWLDAAGLPSSDLSDVHLDSFLFAYRGAEPVGMIGVEKYTDCGLLRSLFVAESSRTLGLGAQLVSELEKRTTAAGLQSLWLLTIDADPFFARQGYAIMQRVDAPESVRQSAEFSTLCPGDAVLMRKVLVES
ncbi:MAG: arsenic resistance N-acetyltransferase ArsN2 [Woeseiaceae bacterium]